MSSATHRSLEGAAALGPADVNRRIDTHMQAQMAVLNLAPPEANDTAPPPRDLNIGDGLAGRTVACDGKGMT
ncbi:MAG: hypothetical protein JWR89_3472 [Tardiphaga sp.]|nr:hypothetical protein [Tardiphaga sp.]